MRTEMYNRKAVGTGLCVEFRVPMMLATDSVG